MNRKKFAALTATVAMLVGGAIAYTAGADADPVWPHAQLSTSYDQHDGGLVEFDQVDSIAGASFDAATNELTLDVGGVWTIIAAPQVGSVQQQKAAQGSANFWIAVNGVAVPNSNVTWAENSNGVGDVIISQGVGQFAAGDIITVEWSTTGPSLEAIYTEGEPLTPSIIFSAIYEG